MRTCVVAVALCGLASSLAMAAGPGTLTITIASDPVGATIYLLPPDATSTRAPGTLSFPPGAVRLPYHNLTPEFVSGTACMEIPWSVLVRWPSGVEVSVPSLRACPENGAEQEITVMRPTGIPNGDRDVDLAWLREQIARLRGEIAQQDAEYQIVLGLITQQRTQQRAQERNAALADLSRSLSRALATPYVPYRPPVNCTSNVVGTYIYTNCY